MRAYVSVDLEGMPYVVSPLHLEPGKPLFEEARKIATRVVLAAAEELRERGFGEVVVADSHGYMVNVLVEELPEYVSLIRGFPRPVSMMTAVEGSDAVLMLGYHAKAGTKRASMDHTYSGAAIGAVYVNGIEVSEFLLNALLAGHYGVPVVLLAGDRALAEDVEKYAPWVEFVALKESYSRYSAKSPGLERILEDLRGAVARACRKLERGEARPLEAGNPVEIKVVFVNSAYADAAELLPGAEREGGLAVSYEARDMAEAYRVLELMVLACAGVREILRR